MFYRWHGYKKLLVSLPMAHLPLSNFTCLKVFEKAPLKKKKKQTFIIVEGSQGILVLTIIIWLFLQLFLLGLANPRLDIGYDAK